MCVNYVCGDECYLCVWIIYVVMGVIVCVDNVCDDECYLRLWIMYVEMSVTYVCGRCMW